MGLFLAVVLAATAVLSASGAEPEKQTDVTVNPPGVNGGSGVWACKGEKV